MAVKDLSSVHALISDLFHWPDSAAGWKQYELAQEQVDFFRTNGFVSGIKMLEEDQVEAIRDELAEIADPTIPVMNYFMNFIPTNQPIRRIFFFTRWVPGVLQPVCMMYCGTRVSL
jgi:hypothetical protein